MQVPDLSKIETSYTIARCIILLFTVLAGSFGITVDFRTFIIRRSDFQIFLSLLLSFVFALLVRVVRSDCLKIGFFRAWTLSGVGDSILLTAASIYRFWNGIPLDFR